MVYLIRSWMLYFTLGLIFMLNLSACAKKQIKKVPEQPPKSVEETKVEKEGIETEELSIHDKDFSSSQKLGNVYFDFDSHNLSEEARETLSTNATYLKKNSRLEILVEGNCDERGTIAY